VRTGGGAVSAFDDETLKVWNLKTGAVIATFTCDAAPYRCDCRCGKLLSNTVETADAAHPRQH
jgi:WD40 repeat protein